MHYNTITICILLHFITRYTSVKLRSGLSSFHFLYFLLAILEITLVLFVFRLRISVPIPSLQS